LDAFFEAVMVMAKEDDLRENRLSMLRAITELFAAIADFRLLEV
jgi:glycyl-tRNA synthetase beta chain